MNEEIRSIAEECSNPKSRVDELALLQLRPYFESFFDGTWLSIALRNYETWASKNSAPFLQRTLLHSPPGFNILVASIWAARDWENIYKKEPSFRVPAGAKRLLSISCSLAILELHAGKLLDQAARECLKQRFQAACEVWGIAHELNTFAFFIRQGAEVDPCFLKVANKTDVTVHWHGVEIPVQCKAKLPGSGREISQGIVTSLAVCIARDARVLGKKLLVRIGSTGAIRNGDIEFLRRQVSSGVGASIGPCLVTNAQRTFTVRSQPLSGKFTVKTIRDYLSSFNFHVGMVIGEPARNGGAYDAFAVVGIEANM